jgi:hypothetical protein
MGKPKQRSLPEIKDWQALAILAGAVALFFRDILFGKAFFWEDFLYYYYPSRTFAAMSLAGGVLPLWNPYTFVGMPFQADIQSALFYLPNLLLTFFVHNGRLSPYWLELQIIVHYLIAAGGAYFLARSTGLRSIPSLFAGLVYGLSGFMITRAIHQPVICEAAWLPLIVLLFRRVLASSSPALMILTGLLLGQTVLAGFPQMTLYIFLFLFLLFLYEFSRAIADRGLRTVWPLAPLAGGVIVIAVALAAIQLLPTIELAPLSQRAAISFQKSLEGQMTWAQLITLVIPKFFGASGAQAATFWGEGGYGTYWETALYLGVGALVFTAVALAHLRRNPFLIFLTAIALFSLLVSLGDGFFLHGILFRYVPGFDKFRNPARIGILFTLACALLAGHGFQIFFTMTETARRRARAVIIATAVAGLLIWLAVQGGMLQPGGDPQRLKAISAIAHAEAATMAVILLVACGAMAAALRAGLSYTVPAAVLLLVQFVDMNLFGFTQNNGTLDPEAYFARPASLVSAMREEGKADLFRINARQGSTMILDRNQGMVDGVFTLEGYTPLVLQKVYPPAQDWEHVCRLLNAKYRILVDDQQRTMNIGITRQWLPRAFMVYRSLVIQGDEEQKAVMASADFDPARTVILDSTPPAQSYDTTFTDAWRTHFTAYELNSMALDVMTPKDGYLVFSEIFYPGWQAFVDGVPHPLFRADWSLRALVLPAGEHRIELRFVAPPFRAGAWITLATIGLSAAGLIYWTRKKPAT